MPKNPDHELEVISLPGSAIAEDPLMDASQYQPLDRGRPRTPSNDHARHASPIRPARSHTPTADASGFILLDRTSSRGSTRSIIEFKEFRIASPAMQPILERLLENESNELVNRILAEIALEAPEVPKSKIHARWIPNSKLISSSIHEIKEWWKQIHFSNVFMDSDGKEPGDHWYAFIAPYVRIAGAAILVGYGSYLVVRVRYLYSYTASIFKNLPSSISKLCCGCKEINLHVQYYTIRWDWLFQALSRYSVACQMPPPIS